MNTKSAAISRTMNLILDGALVMDICFTEEEMAAYVAERLHTEPNRVISTVILALRQAVKEKIFSVSGKKYSLIEFSVPRHLNAMEIAAKKSQKSSRKGKKKKRRANSKGKGQTNTKSSQKSPSRRGRSLSDGNTSNKAAASAEKKPKGESLSKSESYTSNQANENRNNDSISGDNSGDD